MGAKRFFLIICAAFVLSIVLPPIHAQEDLKNKQDSSDQLVGVWEIYRVKEPGKPYGQGFQGVPFVNKGPNAYTLLMEYKSDGTFKKTSRRGNSEMVEDGAWKLTGNELRQKRRGLLEEEVLYLRFDDNNHYTSTEVFENSANLGIFVQFQRIR